MTMGQQQHEIAVANCAIVRQAVAEGHHTPAEVADMTGLSRTSAYSHLRHNVWDGHLVRLGSQYFRIEQRSTSA